MTRCDGSGRLYTRGIDLSATGISVVSTEAYSVGTAVRCTLLLAGGPRGADGRIVRVTALSKGIGLAIAFTALDASTAATIQRLVNTRLQESLPARLRVDGLERPLRCEARLDDGAPSLAGPVPAGPRSSRGARGARTGTDRGAAEPSAGERRVRLTAMLPFLRLDDAVDVLLGQDAAGGPAEIAPGVITNIALDPSAADGIPRLALDVSLAAGRYAGRTPVLGGPVWGPADPGISPPPSELPPPYGALPSVMLAPGLVRDLFVFDEPPAPRRRGWGTAEISRRGRAGMPRRSATTRTSASRWGSTARVGSAVTERIDRLADRRPRGWRAWLARLARSLS